MPRAEAQTSATERIALYSTWLPSVLTTRPHGQVVRSCDPLNNFGVSNHVTGMAELKVVKFCTQVG